MGGTGAVFGRMIGPLMSSAKAPGTQRRGRQLTRRGSIRTGQRRLPAGARADAEAVGGLDERYFMYTEDVDFARPFADAPTNLVHPGGRVTHLRGRSAASAPAATRSTTGAARSLSMKNIPRMVPLLSCMSDLLVDDPSHITAAPRPQSLVVIAKVAVVLAIGLGGVFG